MAQILEPDEIAALIERNRRVGEALRNLLVGVTGGAGPDLSIFAPGAMVSRGYMNQISPVHRNTDSGSAEADHGGREPEQRPQAAAPTFRRENFEIHPGLDGFTLEEVMIKEGTDGTTKQARVCMVCTVEPGKIAHVEEYADSSQLKEVRAP
jgi:hypothetical protein